MHMQKQKKLSPPTLAALISIIVLGGCSDDKNDNRPEPDTAYTGNVHFEADDGLTAIDPFSADTGSHWFSHKVESSGYPYDVEIRSSLLGSTVKDTTLEILSNDYDFTVKGDSSLAAYSRDYWSQFNKDLEIAQYNPSTTHISLVSSYNLTSDDLFDLEEQSHKAILSNISSGLVTWQLSSDAETQQRDLENVTLTLTGCSDDVVFEPVTISQENFDGSSDVKGSGYAYLHLASLLSMSDVDFDEVKPLGCQLSIGYTVDDLAVHSLSLGELASFEPNDWINIVFKTKTYTPDDEGTVLVTHSNPKADDGTLPQNPTYDVTVMMPKPDGGKAELIRFIQDRDQSAVENFNTEDITDMSSLFAGITDGFSPDLTGWDVSNVTNMANMFDDSNFNGDISTWKPRNVTNMGNMFRKSEFSGDISNWETDSLTSLSGAFSETSSFQSDLGNWDVSNVENMSYIFYHFKGDFNNLNIELWNPVSLKNLIQSFNNSTFNGDLCNWQPTALESLLFTFGESEFNQPLGCWDQVVATVTNFQTTFFDTPFNQDISGWDTGSATNLRSMFMRAESFDQDLSNWNVSNVTQTRDMFNSAISFNSPLNWDDLSSLTELRDMFNGASTFEQDLSGWVLNCNVSRSGIFSGAPINDNQELHPDWDAQCED